MIRLIEGRREVICLTEQAYLSSEVYSSLAESCCLSFDEAGLKEHEQLIVFLKIIIFLGIFCRLEVQSGCSCSPPYSNSYLPLSRYTDVNSPLCTTRREWPNNP